MLHIGMLACYLGVCLMIGVGLFHLGEKIRTCLVAHPLRLFLDSAALKTVSASELQTAHVQKVYHPKP